MGGGLSDSGVGGNGSDVGGVQRHGGREEGVPPKQHFPRGEGVLQGRPDRQTPRTGS